MSTFTPNLNFELPTPGSDDAAWGGMLNGNWSALDTLLNDLTDQVTALAEQVERNKVPVGGLYLSTTDTDPATTLGYGTWAAHAAGRALVGVGNNGTRNWTIGLADGAESVVLTEAQMPAHAHAGSVTVSGGTSTATLTGRLAGDGNRAPFSGSENNGIVSQGYGAGNLSSGTGQDGYKYVDINASHAHTVSASGAFATDVRGASSAHNNVQPSIAVYVWRRTA